MKWLALAFLVGGTTLSLAAAAQGNALDPSWFTALSNQGLAIALVAGGAVWGVTRLDKQLTRISETLSKLASLIEAQNEKR